jgi:hypothetical protein
LRPTRRENNPEKSVVVRLIKIVRHIRLRASGNSN